MAIDVDEINAKGCHEEEQKLHAVSTTYPLSLEALPDEQDV